MKKGLAVFSGSAVVHKLMQDGTVVLGTAANPAAVTVSGSVNVTGQMTASADSIEVSNVRDNFTATTLGGILVELKTSGSAGAAAVDARLTSVSSSLKSYVDAQDVAVGNAAAAALGAYTASNNAALTALSNSVGSEIARVDGRITTLIGSGSIASTLDTIKEIADFLDGDGAAAVDLTAKVAAISSSLVQEITDRAAAVTGLSGSVSNSLAAEISARIAGDQAVQSNLDSVSGSLKAAIDAIATASAGDTSALSSSFSSALAQEISVEISRATGAEAGLQSQIDASAFQVNGLSVDAKSGSFTIVTGSSNNLAIISAGSVVTVDLNSSVTLAGTLSANVVTASAGLSVVGGASVAGGMTVSSGDMKVSHGAMSVKMTREEAVTRGAGEDGDMFYCTSATDDPASAFPRGKAWYFKQNGDWFDAPFYGEG